MTDPVPRQAAGRVIFLRTADNEMRDQGKAPSHGQAIVDRLSRRSMWLFALLALLAGAAYFLLAGQAADERASAAEINLAGRRRMLSQHIGLVASQLLQRPDPGERAHFGDALKQMAEIHRTLIDGTPDRRIRPLPPALAPAFFAPDGVDARMQAFLDLGRRLLALPADAPEFRPTAEALIAMSRGELLSLLDRQVGDYQAAGEQGSDTQRLLQWLALMAGLGLLGFSAFGVLRPLIAQVRATLGDLESSEGALRRAMLENRLILETTDDGIFGVDRHGDIRFANPAAAALLGLPAGDLVGRPHHPAILAASSDCPVCRTLATGTPAHVADGRFLRRGESGDDFPVEYSVALRPDGEGAVVSFRDIADRQRTELTLQRFQQRLVDAVEAMDDAFALFDADDKLALYNLRFTEFFPLAGEFATIGVRFEDFIREIARRGLYAAPPGQLETWLGDRLAAHRRADASLEIPYADDRWLRATERRTREGGTVVIWTDVTHLKRALIAADRGSRAKSEFLARMSHELRTPLNAILGFAQLLAQGSLENAQREQVDHILHGGRHLLALITEVLDLSAIEAGKLEVEAEDVALAPLIEECLALISPLAAHRGIHIASRVPEAAVVRADRKRLKQVVINLLSNAVKYNRPAGEVAVAVAATPAETTLAVSDTGRGIPPELAGRVFEPFDRLGAEQVEGSGIGLAITRRLTELMGGRIGFDSIPGQGSTFRLCLPTVVAAEPLPALPAADAPPAGEAEKTLLAVGLAAAERQLLQLVARTLPGLRLAAFDGVAEALAAAGGACLAIIAEASALPALREGIGSTPGAPRLIGLGDRPAAPGGNAAADAWQERPLNPRRLARLLREFRDED